MLGSVFEGMTLTHHEGTTTLTGDLRDQAELQGMLQRVSALGLTLLEARAIDDPRAASGQRPPVQAGARSTTRTETRRGGS